MSQAKRAATSTPKNMFRFFVPFALLSAAQGFVVPAEMNLVVDKLVDTMVDTSPPVGGNDPLELAAKTALVPLVLYAPFYRQPRFTHVPAFIEGEIDTDAPVERQVAVDHVVRRQPFTLGLGDMGTWTPPKALQMTFNLYKPEHAFQLPEFDEEYYTLVHDECYLGKDCMAHECVDFDPMH